MLVGVKVALKLWLIILKSRFKIEKSLFYKNCSNKSNLNYLFNKLSSQMKGKKDIKAVRFEFEFTSYVYQFWFSQPLFHIMWAKTSYILYIYINFGSRSLYFILCELRRRTYCTYISILVLAASISYYVS